MFNYNHLYYFYVIANAGKVTRAAEILKTSQPSLTHQMRTLEKSLGKILFQRDGRGIVLTKDGEVIFGFCRQMFGIAGELSDLLRQSAESKGVRARIGVCDEIERPFVAELVARLLRKHSFRIQPSIFMTSGTHEQLVENLRLRTIDMLITNCPVYENEFEEIANLQMPVMAAVGDVLIATMKRHQRLTSLIQIFERFPAGLVMPSNKLIIRQETTAFLKKNKVKRSIVFESDILAAVTRAVIEGVGIGFLPVQYVTSEIKRGDIIVFGPRQGFWKHDVRLLTLKGLGLTTLKRELASALKGREGTYN